jgi:hypothetical protein
LDIEYFLFDQPTPGGGSDVASGYGHYQQVGDNLFLYCGTTVGPPATEFTIELDGISFGQLYFNGTNITVTEPLFTTGSDYVDFNNLLPEQQTAIIQAGGHSFISGKDLAVRMCLRRMRGQQQSPE